MSEFFSALGVAIVLEGVLYAIFPNAAKNMALTILSLPEPMLRRAGAVWPLPQVLPLSGSSGAEIRVSLTFRPLWSGNRWGP